MSGELNSRVLVIDDEESVRDGIKTILSPTRSRHKSELNAAAQALFGDEPAKQENVLSFDVDIARNGHEGIALVQARTKSECPYAVVFCDMRMPGLDGLETVERIRMIDQRCEVVFVTAYSDHSLASITERAGANVTYFVKPFLSDEIRQLATKLVLEWNRAREAESLIRTLANLRGSAEDMHRLVRHLLQQLCWWLNTTSAMVVELDESGNSRFHLGVGELNSEDSTSVASALDLYRSVREEGTIVTKREHIFLRLSEFGIAVSDSGRAPIDASRRYLLEAFLENASLAIRNSRLREELARRERLATIGQALGYVVHDLSSPLSSIDLMARMLELNSSVLGSPQQVAARIRGAIERARASVQDVLDFCSDRLREAGEKKVVAIADELQELTEVWRLMLGERDIRLEVEIEPELRGCVDPNLFGRVVWNLVNNAASALRSQEDGVVRVTCRTATDGGIELQVSDNGPGIPEKELSRLFRPFVTGRKSGTGFGLAIVKQIVVDSHKGTINVTSDEQGTSFQLKFPPCH